MALAAALASWDQPCTSEFAAWRAAELTNAEALVKRTLFPRDIGTQKGPTLTASDLQEIEKAVLHLRENARLNEVAQDFLDSVESRFHLVKKDINRLLNRLRSNAALAVNPEPDNILVDMLDRIAIWQRVWGSPLKHLGDSSFATQFITVFHSLLHSSLPPIFPDYLRDLFTASLSALPEHLIDPPKSETVLGDIPHTYYRVPPPSAHLSRLGIFPRYATTLSRVAFDEIERIAKEEAAKGWDTRRLTRARQRVGEGVANWLSGTLDGKENNQGFMKPLFSRFDFHLCKCFFDIRTDELFDITVDYPDSMAALEDLKECLFKVDQRDILVEKLRASNLKRLLHPGAETKDVISQYISTIRCLRILDPPGVLLHKVAEPIRRHLKARSDTVKCVVATLVEGDELQDENEAGGLIQTSNDDTVEDFLDPKWDPEPVDAAPLFRSGKSGDIVSTLVSIYDTREVIIKELQVLLATRLLAVKDYDAVREIRTIELLKLRFGEPTLQVCDVMLKDMADSKRINDHIQGTQAQSVVHPLVISRMFWPNIPASSLHLPPKLQQLQQDYEAAFHHFKPDKRLRWLQHIGSVVVKLDLADRVVEVEATPLQASITELFENQDTWTVQAMSERLGVDLFQIRNGLAFWANEGVVKEEKGVWRLLEIAEKGNDAPAFVQEEPAVEGVDQSGAENVREHWQFIKGMLTSLGPKTLEDIQHNLESLEDGYEQSLQALELFMLSARQEGLVDRDSEGRWNLSGGG